MQLFCGFNAVWHNVKCAVCKAQPIRGLRYRCLRCMGYEQCQTCFLTGQANRKHKLSHPMQEYVGQVSSTALSSHLLCGEMNKNYYQFLMNNLFSDILYGGHQSFPEGVKKQSMSNIL